MSYAPPSPQAAPTRKRGVIPYLAAGCAVLGLCVLCAAVAGGGYFFYNQRSVTTLSAPAVEYILDATKRMALLANGENDTRLNVARGVLAEIVRPSDPAVTAGLRVFGSGAQPATCSDTALLVPLAPASQTQISTHLLSIINGVNPDAAMSQAMISAIRDLAAVKGKHTLVVVTGGADSCNPQASALIAAEAQRASIDLKLFVVGFQVPDGDGNAIKGVVDAAGGNYIEADNKKQLTEVIQAIQQFAQDQKSTNVTNVMGTAVAAVGTQNVIVAATLPAAGTAVAGNPTTPVVLSTPAPTSTPGGVATTSATAGPTAAPTQGSVAPGGVGQTACDHPYFPMRPGSTWTFSTNTGPMTWNVSGVTGDQTSATAVVGFNMDKVSGTYNWVCTADGIQSYDFGSLSTGTGGGDIKVTEHSGQWLPSADKLVPGATWDNSYTFSFSAGSGATAMSLTETFEQHFTLVGIEAHDVAGKSMQALHIETTGNAKVAGLSGGVGDMSFNTNSTYWLVQGIGPVELTSVFGKTTSTSTLTSYSIP